MGRQITVELQALEALCHLDCYEETYEYPFMDAWGAEQLGEETIHFVTVCTPQWQTITLCAFGRHGCFDCRGPSSPTYWFEEWLTQNKVPFLEG